MDREFFESWKEDKIELTAEEVDILLQADHPAIRQMTKEFFPKHAAGHEERMKNKRP